MRQLREVYIIYASAGVSLDSNGDFVPDQLDVAFVEYGSEINIAELAYLEQGFVLRCRENMGLASGNR